MAYQSKYTGLQIDDILDSVEWKEGKIEDLEQIRAGAQKGATALQSYTEKYTGTVTGIKINGETKSGSGIIDLGTISTDISGKVDKVAGKQLSTEDFTTALKTKLEGLSNYDDTELSEALSTLRGDFDSIVSGDTTTAIKTFNEVIAFLDGLTDTQDLESIIASIEQQIAGKMDTLISGTNIKTINGESILGSGDITISGGGSGEDIRYFTEFTVEQVVAAGGWLPLSNGTSELYTVAENNKLICIPCQDGLNGFIVASYEVTLDEELYVSFIYGNVYYRMIATPLGLDISIQPLLTQTVFVDSGSIDVYDNTNYVVTAPVTSVYITIMGKSNVGSTIRFTTGEDCSLRITGNSIWANGVIPTIESGVTYELSIIRQSIAGSNKVLAVLTPFKPVE